MIRRFLASGFLGLFLTMILGAAPGFPVNPKDMKATLPFDAVCDYLKSINQPGLVEVREIGRSAGGRPILLVRLNRGGAKARFRVLLYAQQHGDEVSGKDALVYLIRSIAEHPERLPEDVDLSIVPVFNPDGAVANRRTNDAKADLNRDHLLLSQPETQAFHRAARQIQPHLAVDCHEFTRDNQDHRKAGWERWPLITLDASNHPLIPRYLRDAGLEMVETAGPVMAAAGYPFARYMLGGPPPDEEYRPSTLEADDARNSLGSAGTLSFIIEAGIRRHAPDPQHDLGIRVSAYLRLLDHLMGTPSSRARVLELAGQARREPLPAFIATNAFWGNVQGKVAAVKVVGLGKDTIHEIPTANVMLDPIIKSSVLTPRAYAIEPRAADLIRPLLQRHGLQFQEISSPIRRQAETCRLLRVEDAYDEVYQRYEHRQIVQRDTVAELELAARTLIVPLDQPLARRAIQLLEPCLLYGLYSHSGFRPPSGSLPVSRLF